MRRQARERWTQEFGAMTEREYAMVRRAYQRGYLRGYKVARREGRVAA